jgi:molybdopterin/thiamine biosynthesis adenylyltransferase
MRDPIRVIVVGAGGVGTWLCQGLVRQLEYSAPGSALIIVDGDNFEEKNKERQSFHGVGNKAEVLARELQPMFPQTFVVPQAAWIVESVDDTIPEEESDSDEPIATKIAASALLTNGDVIYAVVDNDAARKTLIEAASVLDNVDLFTAGNDENYYGSVYHYRRRDGEDVTINPIKNHPEYENPNDRNPGEMSCQERAEIDGGTQLVATNMAVASLLLGRTHKMILSDGEFYIDEDSGDGDQEIFFDLGVGKAQGAIRLAVQQPQLQEV